MKIIYINIAIVISVFFMLSCEGVNDIYERGRDYSIGDTGPAGGIIFYVNVNYEDDGWMYLEAAAEDEGSYNWSGAVQVCNIKNSGVYSDWTLPSIIELVLIYNELKVENLGNIASSPYWSSTGIDASNAYSVEMHNGNASVSSSKNDLKIVRAIRRF